VIAQIVVVTIQVLTILIVIRALISWVPQLIDPRGPIAEFLYTTTEPILAPIRSIMPRMMFDFSPIIAILVLQAISRVIASNIG
jgi:YggT family protein